MLADGVLEGRTIGVWGADAELRALLERLGASTTSQSVGSPPTSEADPTLSAGGGSSARIDTLVADARSAFTDAGCGYAGVRAAVDGAFAASRDAAVEHWIDRPGGGQAVLVAPTPGAGRHAGAARAALENLARTLSTEWARYAVTTVAVLPGDATTPGALADLVAWLASPAGAYLSGTALTLDRSG